MDVQPASIQNLPAEMLGYIFEGCVEDEEGELDLVGIGVSPWLLALVCRYWYQTVKGTPSLWRKILVTNDFDCYWSLRRNAGQSLSSYQQSWQSGGTRIHSAVQVCVSPEEIAIALERTGRASLEITLSFVEAPGDPTAQRDIPFYQEVYNMIFNPRISPRISRLAFEAKTSFGGEWEWEWWSGKELESVSALSAPFRNLISLEIHSSTPLSVYQENGASLLEGILSTARKLEHLHLSKGPIPHELKYSTWSSSSYASVILNLREIKVKSASFLEEILGAVSGIETLVIEGAAQVAKAKDEQVWDVRTTAWPTQTTPEIKFERLTRLHLILDDFSLLNRLGLPLVQQLRLTQSYQPRNQLERNLNGYPPSHQYFTMDLPSLVALRVRSPSIAPLNRFNMPLLKRLHITSTRVTQGKADADFAAFISGAASSAFATVVNASHLERVQYLYLNAILSEKGTLSTLKAFPSLQTLHLVPGGKIGKSIIQELSMNKHKNDAVRVLCTELTKIEIDCHSFCQWDKKEKRYKRVGTTMPEAIYDMVEKLAASRKEWGNQMECCILTATDGVKKDYAR